MSCNGLCVCVCVCGGGGWVVLQALLAEVCPTAMSGSAAEHDPMLAFAAGGHGVLPPLIAFKKSGAKASGQQATTRPTSAPTK